MAPVVILTVFPERVSQLLNMKRSLRSPVVLSYKIPPVAERDVRFILLLNIFQSLAESAPTVALEASEREIC